MADILIRGIEMPDNVEGGEVIIRIQPNGEVLSAHKFHIGATAIPLPEGHGRMVDADAFEDAFIRYYLSQERSNHLVFTPVEIKQHLADMIADFPTIVPAEGGTDE